MLYECVIFPYPPMDPTSGMKVVHSGHHLCLIVNESLTNSLHNVKQITHSITFRNIKGEIIRVIEIRGAEHMQNKGNLSNTFL